MASSTSTGPTDLTVAELQSLERQNLCSRSIRAGQVTVSGAFLGAPSSGTTITGTLPTSSSSASSPTATVRTKGFDTGTARRGERTFDIPIKAESVEALEFIGFVPETANTIFQNYRLRPDPDRNPDGLMDYVYGWVSMLSSPRLEDLTPRQAMTRIGLTEERQEALTDPRFAQMMGTETLHFWVVDTLRMNYAALLGLQQRLKNHA